MLASLALLRTLFYWRSGIINPLLQIQTIEYSEVLLELHRQYYLLNTIDKLIIVSLWYNYYSFVTAPSSTDIRQNLWSLQFEKLNV